MTVAATARSGADTGESGLPRLPQEDSSPRHLETARGRLECAVKRARRRGGRARTCDQRDVPPGPRPAYTTRGRAHHTLAAVPQPRRPKPLARDKEHAPVWVACSRSWCDQDKQVAIGGTLSFSEQAVDVARRSYRAHHAALRARGLTPRRSGRGPCVPCDDAQRGSRGRPWWTYACESRASSRASGCLADRCASLRFLLSMPRAYPGHKPSEYTDACFALSTHQCIVRLTVPTRSSRRATTWRLRC